MQHAKKVVSDSPGLVDFAIATIKVLITCSRCAEKKDGSLRLCVDFREFNGRIDST